MGGVIPVPALDWPHPVNPNGVSAIYGMTGIRKATNEIGDSVTLILTLANSRQAVLLSDRRLSWRGRPTTEQSNKATVLVCADGRFALGLSGIAEVGKFRTDDWIVDRL